MNYTKYLNCHNCKDTGLYCKKHRKEVELKLKKQELQKILETNSNNTLLSPLKQMKLKGITNQDVTCKDGLELIFKFDGQPACVKPSSVEKLTSWN